MEGEKEGARDKPLEKSQKSYETILEQTMTQAETELHRPARDLFVSAFSGGLDLGLGILAMAMTMTLLGDVLSNPLVHFISSNVYTLGFVFVVIANSALFTEHTTSAITPVLDGRVEVRKLFRLWGIVLAGNLLGAAIFAAVVSWLGPAAEITSRESFAEMGGKLVHMHWYTMFGLAIFAGWLMGLLAWLTSAARDTTSQIFFIWGPTFLIGLGHMPHSIAGTVEVLLALFAGAGGVTGYDVVVFLFWSVLGNAIGGALIVALSKYAHASQ